MRRFGFYAFSADTQRVQDIFDCLINSYIDHKVGLADNFLSPSLAAHLKQNLSNLHAENRFQHARMGNDFQPVQDHRMRGDQIYWLDRAHNDPHENAFFDLIDGFIQYLNSSCYTGITGYEFHYTLYEKGSFYRRHLDQFRNNKSRAFSMILYLNSDWQEKDGGELCVFHPDHVQTIAPNNGKCVFFKSSEMEHEVLETQAPRLSITGWLKT